MKKFLALALLGVSAGAFAQVWDSGTGLGWNITDNATFTWNFTPTGVSGQLTQFDIYMSPAHTWRGDLTIDLMDPQAHTVRLANRLGTSGDFISAFYSDSGIADPGSGNLDSATTGSLYLPQSGTIGGLSQSTGQWTLTVSDGAAGDTGTIDRIRVHTAGVPEPASMAVLGLGALALLRRRRKA